MGRSSKQRKRGNKSGAKPGGSTAIPTGPYTLHLVAEPEFYEAADSAGCPCSLKDHDEDGLPGLVLVVDDLGKLADLLEWFAAGAAEDTNAKLQFPLTLSKGARANIHSLVSSKFGATLEAYSQGIGESRHISICKKGMAPSLTLTPEQQDRVLLLYALAKEAGLTFSRDEIAACVQQGQLPGPLAELWEIGGKQHEASQQLCMAAALGDLPTLQALLKAHPEVVQASVKELRQGRLPLQVAAVAGQLDSLRALHAAGADLEAVDADGLTALQAARRAEQCEAEAILLQLGAEDPEADVMPVTSHALVAGKAPAEAAGLRPNGCSHSEEAQQSAHVVAPADDAPGTAPEQPKAVQADDELEAPRKVVAPLEVEEVPAAEQLVPVVEEVKLAVETPAVDKPALEEPAVEEPAVEEPAVEEPAVEEPAVEKPAVEEPAVEEPAVEEPAVEEPAVEEPAVEEPAVEELVPAVEEVRGVTHAHAGAEADPSAPVSAKLNDEVQHVSSHQIPTSNGCAALGEATPALDEPAVHASTAEQAPCDAPAASTERSRTNSKEPFGTALQQPQEPSGSTQHLQEPAKARTSTCPAPASPSMHATNTWAAIGTGLALCAVAGLAYRSWRTQ